MQVTAGNSKQRRLKILQVSKFYAPHRGGIESATQEATEGLNHTGRFEVQVLACQPFVGKGTVQEINGATIYKASTLVMLMRVPLSWEFVRLFRDLGPHCDAVILHHPSPLGFVAAVLYSRQTRIIVWYHSDIVRQRLSSRVLNPLWHVVLKRASEVIISSHRMIQASPLLRKYSDKCVIVPYGVDLERFEATPALMHGAEEIKRKFGSPIVLAVGRLVYYKGFEYLIEALKPIHATLIIVGSGPLKEHLLQLSADHGVSEKVFILEQVADVAPYYYACDVFVLPSIALSEAFGVVQVEAMACGKPVINTYLPTTVPEVSLHDQTGITVPPCDAQALSDAIQLLLGNPELRHRMGIAARQRARVRFSRDAMVRGLATLLLTEPEPFTEDDATAAVM